MQDAQPAERLHQSARFGNGVRRLGMIVDRAAAEVDKLEDQPIVAATGALTRSASSASRLE